MGTVATRLEALVDELAPDLVWCILSSLDVVDAMHGLAARLGPQRLRVQVWDDVEYLCMRAGAGRFGARRYIDRARALMGTAGMTAVISENMGEHYERTCGARTTVVRQGTVESVGPLERSEGEFVIGFSGAIYARTALAALISALGTVDWCIAGRRVRLRIMGIVAELAFDGPAHVELRGRHLPASLDALLAECDLLYLPQAFEPHLEAFTRLSFPTKLSSYAGVGRPIMVHAPPYGSVAAFCRRTAVGALIESLDVDAILGALEPLVSDSGHYARAARAAASVGNGELGREQFRCALRTFLGC
jgi:hypothetical protein